MKCKFNLTFVCLVAPVWGWTVAPCARGRSVMVAQLDQPSPTRPASCTLETKTDHRGGQVFHLGVHRPRFNSAVDIISAETSLSAAAVRALMGLGAVYVGKLAQKPAKGAPEEHNCQQASAAPSPTTTHFRVKNVQRLLEDYDDLPRGTYLRVHADPRRFPAAGDVEWARRIVSKDEDFVVVDKPAGVPSVPTLDNRVETAMHQVSLALGLEEEPSDSPSGNNPPPLHAVMRLDVCTSGVLLFARTKAAAAAFGTRLQNRKVAKVYRVLTDGPVPLGKALHCCRPKRFRGSGAPRVYAAYDPRLVSGDDPASGGREWQDAEMRVLSCAPAATGAAAAVAAAAAAAGAGGGGGDGGDGPGGGGGGGDVLPLTMYDSEVALITGRTHQIRLQMAAMGVGVVGDTRYAGVVGKVHGLTAEDDGTGLFGEEPAVVGLHASRVAFTWRGKIVEHRSGRPWWAEAEEEEEEE